jgi:hypothetical protein
MSQGSVLGIDITKQWFHLVGMDNTGPIIGAEQDSCKILAHWLLRTPGGPQTPQVGPVIGPIPTFKP